MAGVGAEGRAGTRQRRLLARWTPRRMRLCSPSTRAAGTAGYMFWAPCSLRDSRPCPRPGSRSSGLYCPGCLTARAAPVSRTETAAALGARSRLHSSLALLTPAASLRILVLFNKLSALHSLWNISQLFSSSFCLIYILLKSLFNLKFNFKVSNKHLYLVFCESIQS